MRRIGFTGTSRAIVPAQRAKLREILSELDPVEAHHGDCVGGDALFHELICESARPVALSALTGRSPRMDHSVVIHPPINTSARAFCGPRCGVSLTILPEKEYIARNHDIVDAVVEMFATPKTMAEEVRSGTWATVRYARKRGRKITIVWPDGTVTVEPGSPVMETRQEGLPWDSD